MKITICGSLKFYDEMLKVEKNLKKLGHKVYMPVKAQGVDYWEEDNTKRVEAKKKLELIRKHLDKIKKSDAILVVNVNKNGVKNYIGANTFLEMGFAYFWKKKVYTLNPPPNQPYILDEIQTIGPIVINGDFKKVK